MKRGLFDSSQEVFDQIRAPRQEQQHIQLPALPAHTSEMTFPGETVKYRLQASD